MVSSTYSSPRKMGHKRKERDFDNDAMGDTNIHVVVRCRGRSNREVQENSGIVLQTEGMKGRLIELSLGPSALSNKTYTFDKVFSAAADQSIIYEDVMAPILEEMLAGFNCTVFAYGQTGTGKTYTMSGDMTDTLGLLSDNAGIIPRVLYSLFRKLDDNKTESSVKCSFIELYNEELRDLLSIEETKLKIFDEGNKKSGNNSTIVQGMGESFIKSASEGIKLLQEGSYRRQVAATKCNDLSSRSHTIFTVTTYIKRIGENGEDFVSAGKLNLVDLAGSENVERSGATHKRAAEAGLINKSLLTLGRVINALVDKGSHIPYRESKLTRLLQDSLGGRTKTCIIATVSPAKSNLEETISTLDYAFRAKNIRNKPQMNQMISKKTLLKEFATEIEKLKSELIATRHRNGVYLSNDAYEEMAVESESRRILSEEQAAKIETMETHLRNKVQELFSLTSSFNILKNDNESTKNLLEETKGVLEKTEIVLANTRQNLAQETALRKAHASTEEQLSKIGGELITTLEKTTQDVDGLQSKLRRKSGIRASNQNRWETSKDHVSDLAQTVDQKVDSFQRQQEQLLIELESRIQSFATDELREADIWQDRLREKGDSLTESEKELEKQTLSARDEMNNVLEEIKVLREDVKQKVGEGLNGLSAAAGRISGEIINELGEFQTQLHASYSSLGRDFKGIFEELSKHLDSQALEITRLRQELSQAQHALLDSNISASNRLETCLAEERQQSSADRQNLLVQITDLINKTGETQDARLNTKVNAIREDFFASQATFEAANLKHNEEMDNWTEKERSLLTEVIESRDTLKGKMKNDWNAISDRNTAIQSTTKSVHEETIRIVDAQMKDMALQMQALDEFVTRARSQNGEHHDMHLQALRGVSSSVQDAYSSFREDFDTVKSRISAFEEGVNTSTKELQNSLQILNEHVRQPLTDLHLEDLEEYVPTGNTPPKTQYHYITNLPRTDTSQFLTKLRRPNPTVASNSSPAKSRVYTDTREGSEDPDYHIHPRPSSASAALPPHPNPQTHAPTLKELDMNVLSSSTSSISNSTSTSDSISSSRPSTATATPVATTPKGKLKESAQMLPPPLKKHAGMAVSKLPRSGERRRRGTAREERENVVVAATSTAGIGRRLRSSRNSGAR
ncbi:MAG: kinesin motor protein cin8 [Cirrosporium novae-zelandiae]|nr:MAG: kinesin motor protein cin8 [Cirrosporium novae-zelandiae]